MNIKSVEINNILSIDKVRLEFGESGLILLDGWNYDMDSSNGAGKTAIFNSISFALFGKLPRKTLVSKILRRGTKRGYVHVAVETGSGTIEVVRHRPNKVEFFEDGSRVDMSQEEFESRVGINYKQYLICMYSAQTEARKFLFLNDSDKKDFILDVMGLDKFSDYKKEADSASKKLNDDKRDIEDKVEQARSKISVHEENVVDVDSIESEISDLDVSGLKDRLLSLDAVEKPDLSSVGSLREKVNSQLSKLDSKDAEMRSIKAERDHVDRELRRVRESDTDMPHEVECPHCGGEFGLSEADGSVVTKDMLESRRSEKVDTLEKNLRDLDTKLFDYPDIDAKRMELNSILHKAQETEQKKMADYRDSLEKSRELSKTISDREARIELLRSKIEASNKASAKIAELSEFVSCARDNIKRLEDEILLYDSASEVLSPTGAPAYIMDSVVDMFNEYMSEYVSVMWPTATYRLQSFKQNSDGEVRAKFSEKLVIDGREHSIGELSGGEQRCLSIAADVSIMEVVANTLNCHINPVVFDEPFLELDVSNTERAVQILAKAAEKRQVWVIDHTSESKALFSDTIFVEKKAGTSSLST